VTGLHAKGVEIMEDDFGTYSQAIADYKAAEQQGNEVAEKIKNILSPLFTHWKHYCLSGLPEPTPAILTKLGSPLNHRRKQIDVGSINADLCNLQSYMAKFAEAMETAMNARGRIPPDQQAQLLPPPWQIP
jgi:hypothetical protein